MVDDGKVPGRRTIALTILAVCTLLSEFILGLAGNLGANNLQSNPGKFEFFVTHPFVVAAVLIIAGIVGVFLWRRFDAPLVEVDLLKEVDAVAETLAVRLREGWSEEVSLRLVDRPTSLPVAWKNDDENESGTFEDVTDIFERTGRLVVLGSRGAGKTVLAIRFVLGLLPQPGELADGRALPVLINLSNWNPQETSYRDWLEQELIAAHPALARTVAGSLRMARELLDRGRILPVLDGLDEMSSELRAEALRVLARTLRRSDRLLLTSRPTEYTAAVRAAQSIPASHIIVLQDLKPEDLMPFLDYAAWESALDDDSLRGALSTPLNAFLARKVCESGSYTPNDLRMLGDEAAIRDHLMRQFVPAVYAAKNTRAERQLAFLASHLVATGSVHLRWWELGRSFTPKDCRQLGAGFGIACMLFTILLEAPVSMAIDQGVGILTAVLDGLVIGLIAGYLTTASMRRSNVLGRPLAPLPVRIGGRRRSVSSTDRYNTHGARKFAKRLGVLVGGTSAFVFWLGSLRLLDLSTLANFPIIALQTGVPVALAAWFATWLSARIEVPVGLGRTVSPRYLLRLDRTAAWTEAGLYGAAAAILGSIFYSVFGIGLVALVQLLTRGSASVGSANGEMIAAYAAFPAVETAVIVILIFPFVLTAWGRFVVVRAYCGVMGHLPFRLMRFLNRAHELGVLRQAGSVYQFRHTAIRDALATRKESQSKIGI